MACVPTESHLTGSPLFIWAFKTASRSTVKCVTVTLLVTKHPLSCRKKFPLCIFIFLMDSKVSVGYWMSQKYPNK